METNTSSLQTRFIDRALWRRLMLLAAPMALQNVISFSVGLADNLMVGSLGERALSGVYVANQILNLLNMLVIGLSSAMMVLASQYWGKRDAGRIRSLVGITTLFGLGTGSLLFAWSMLDPVGILRLFTNDETVIPEAMNYFTVIRWAILFFCFTQILMAAMRVVEHVKIGLWLSLVTFTANVFLNWVFIFGNLGAPKLGVMGAAVATLTVRILECILMIASSCAFVDFSTLKKSCFHGFSDSDSQS